MCDLAVCCILHRCMCQETQHFSWVQSTVGHLAKFKRIINIAHEDRLRLAATCVPHPGAVLHSCTALTVAAEAVKAWLADIAQQLQGERDVILLHFGLDNEATCIKLEVSGAPVAPWCCVLQLCRHGVDRYPWNVSTQHFD